MFKIVIKNKEYIKKNIFVDKKKYSFYSGKTYLANFLILQDENKNLLEAISLYEEQMKVI